MDRWRSGINRQRLAVERGLSGSNRWRLAVDRWRLGIARRRSAVDRGRLGSNGWRLAMTRRLGAALSSAPNNCATAADCPPTAAGYRPNTTDGMFTHFRVLFPAFLLTQGGPWM